MELFPSAPLTPVIRGHLIYAGLPTRDSDEKKGNASKIPDAEDAAEDPFGLVLVTHYALPVPSI